MHVVMNQKKPALTRVSRPTTATFLPLTDDDDDDDDDDET